MFTGVDGLVTSHFSLELICFANTAPPGRGLDDRVDMVFPTKDEVMLVQLELAKVNGEGENERSAGSLEQLWRDGRRSCQGSKR